MQKRSSRFMGAFATYVSLLLAPFVHSQSFLPQQKPLFDSIKAHAELQEFSGSILIMKGNQELFHYSRGLTHLPSGQPLTTATRYNIGSAGKILTGTLIMQLVAEGKLALDTPVSKYLTAPYRFANASAITLRQLLSHTSGLGDFFDSPDYDEHKTATTDDHFRLVQSMAAPGTPGGGFVYSNSGFIVIGKVLELTNGNDYQELVKQKILLPAGIHIDSPATYATGYRHDNGAWMLGEGNDPHHWTAAGGISLSPVELHKIMYRIVQHDYLPAAYTDTMWAPASHPNDDPPFVHYGLGWMVEQPVGLSLVGHNGGVRGFQAAFRYLPQCDWYIYVFSNRENGAESTFMGIIMALIRQKQHG